MINNFKFSMRFLLVLILFTGSKTVYSNDTLKVMFYNLLNYGNITDYCTLANNSFLDKEKPLQRIVNYAEPDIFGVCELSSNTFVQQRILDSVMNNGNTIKYAKAIHSNVAGSDLISMLYYNSDKLALKSQHVLNSSVRDIVLYKLYYRSPDLQQTNDTAFINCIVSHLKAGSTTADKDSRAVMTSNAMNWIANNGGVGNYLFMGDFNVQNSSEQSFQNLINYTDISLRFYDPINEVGSWNNNSSFAAFHTQSTHTTSNGCASTGGMDDRFDFILASASVMNGLNHYRYIPNSYWAVGNDGNHFNMAINNGSNNSVPSQILSDLFTMSDHLPVVLKLEVDQVGAGFANSKQSEKMIIHQNPFTDVLTLTISSVEKTDWAKIEVYTMNGQLFFSDNYSRPQLNAPIIIQTYNWYPGFYILSFTDKNGVVSAQKIVKL